MSLKTSKYSNKRSISYLGWKSHIDRLKSLNKLLEEKSGALLDFTNHVDNGYASYWEDDIVITRPIGIDHLLPSNGFFQKFREDIRFKVADYPKPQQRYLNDLVEEADFIWKQKVEYFESVNICTAKWSSIDSHDSLVQFIDPLAPTCQRMADLSCEIKLPVARRNVEPDPKQLLRDYYLILKDILEREKNALDKKMRGNIGRVFISTTVDLRNRIRIFLRSLHIPTHDGKDEESDCIVYNNAMSNHFFYFLKHLKWEIIIQTNYPS